MKKIAAPGRRGSQQKRAFVADGDIVDEIDANKTLTMKTNDDENCIAAEDIAAEERRKKIEEEKIKREQEIEREKQEEAIAAAELLRQQQEAEAIAERKRQIREEKLRVEQEAERQRQEAERRRQEAEEAERAKQAEAAAAEQKRLQAAEKMRREQELEKQQQEEAEAAAELIRQQQEAEAIAERKRKIREEKIRQQQEAEEREAREAAQAEKLRLAEEERLRQEQALERKRHEEAEAAAELLRQQQEAEAIAERKRLLREEKLRLEQEAEKQRKEAEEAEAELIRQQEALEEEARERKRLLREEKLRKRKEEEEALRLQQERDEAELLRQQQEEENERQRQLEREEAERIRSELIRQEEIRKIEEERERIEQERIRQEKQNAAKAKSKRDAFLEDMDSFSDAFTQKQALKENKLHETMASEENILASTITTASSSYTAPRNTQKQESQPSVPSLPSASQDEVVVPSYYDQSKVVTSEEKKKTVVQTQNPEQFNVLASALFTSSNSANDIDHDPFAPTNSSKAEEEVLRLPNRSVTVAKNKKENKGGVTFTEQQPEILRGAPTATGSPKSSEPNGYEEGEDEEDEESILPRMTEAEKVAWKAKQEDLTRRRKDFHGACTYAFKGVFAWQMYSAVDAVDEFGKAYTEYLMRCQWGTTWENMQPWLVARRFREFDTLNELLQKNYPDLKNKMHPLPKKLIFGSLTSETIDKRTKEIEEYMATIITDIPQMLRSRYIDEFFGISDRIKTITAQIEELNKKLPQPAPEDEPLFTGMVSMAPGVEEEMGSGDTSKEAKSAPLPEEKEVTVKALQLEDLLTLEDVENLCSDSTRPFDSDELGQVEEYVRDLRSMLRKTKARNIPTDSNCRKYINLCQNNWVRLHRTCLIDPSGASGGVMLIPRAMQAEEELDGAIKELRSLLIAQSMGSPLHF